MEYTFKELEKYCKTNVKNYKNECLAYLIKLLYTHKEKEKRKNIKKNYLTPLFNWTGSKEEELPDFIRFTPKKYNYYIDPFIGGGTLFFYLFPKKAIINDIDPLLINFYKQIKLKNSSKIENFMNKTSLNEEKYNKIKNNLHSSNKLTSAKNFFYVRKLAYKGMNNYDKKGNFITPFENKKIDYSYLSDKRYEKLFSRTKIYNYSFEKIFKMYGNNPDNFFFLDPPYDAKFKDYGFCDFDRKKQEILAKHFKEAKAKCLMIIGETLFIRNLYKNYIKFTYEKVYRYSIEKKDGKIVNNHLVITNY